MADIVDALQAVARQAGDALASMPRDHLRQRYKSPHELVTAADEMSHTIVARELQRAFPGMPMVLEEQLNDAIPASPYLLGDELDGTAMFAAGIADWGVTLALVDGAPTNGVIYLPSRKLMITAIRGGGCRINCEQVVLGSPKSLQDAIFGTELNPRIVGRQRAQLAALTSATLTTRCLACSTASIAELLLGQTQLYVNVGGGKLWDFAAGALAVEEAGGVALRASGLPLRWDSVEMDILLCSSRALADEALLLLQAESRKTS